MKKAEPIIVRCSHSTSIFCHINIMRCVPDFLYIRLFGFFFFRRQITATTLAIATPQPIAEKTI